MRIWRCSKFTFVLLKIGIITMTNAKHFKIWAIPGLFSGLFFTFLSYNDNDIADIVGDRK